jgi:hypothetical protein
VEALAQAVGTMELPSFLAMAVKVFLKLCSRNLRVNLEFARKVDASLVMQEGLLEWYHHSHHHNLLFVATWAFFVATHFERLHQQRSWAPMPDLFHPPQASLCQSPTDLR